MKITVSAIKADIGGIGGHTKPSDELVQEVKRFVSSNAKNLLIDYYIGYTGDDVHIVMTHTLGADNQRIHKLAWDAFKEGTKIAKEQGLYGAGQDFLKDAFSGNVKGMGPGVAEKKWMSVQVKFSVYLLLTRQNQVLLIFPFGEHLLMQGVILVS
jgi:fructose 1,6-bisphosphate aldolase/phosphatase